jgi:hypothetical protein
MQAFIVVMKQLQKQNTDLLTANSLAWSKMGLLEKEIAQLRKCAEYCSSVSVLADKVVEVDAKANVHYVALIEMRDSLNSLWAQLAVRAPNLIPEKRQSPVKVLSPVTPLGSPETPISDLWCDEDAAGSSCS